MQPYGKVRPPRRLDSVAAWPIDRLQLPERRWSLAFNVLLRQANVEPAWPCRDMLDTLAGDVRRHLELASRALADLQPRSGSAGSTTSRTK